MMPKLSIPQKALICSSIFGLGLVANQIIDPASSLDTSNLENRKNIEYYYNFETDVSSTKPSFKVNNESLFLFEHDTERNITRNVQSLEEMASDNISDEDILLAMQDHELIVKMPPIKEYKIRVKVKSVEKASPRIFNLEEFDGEIVSLV
jgi:hypothetical protein